jgi:HK97 family phage prohead protease
MTKNLMMVCEAKLVMEAQSADKEPTGKIEARVTTWGAREGADGRKFNYQPEGFMDWAKTFSAEGKPLPMFLNHAADSMPVGEWTQFDFDDEGMTASGRLYMNTSAGSDLYQIMKESPMMFGGVSVGAYAEEYQYVKEDGTPMTIGSDDPYNDGYFQITKGGLREVSVVMYPNNPMAEVHKLEYFRDDGSANLKNLEKALREAGISKKDAVTSASVFKKVLEQRDAVQTPIENAPQQSESDVDVTEADILKALEMRELSKTLDKRLKG